jgi:hypothetical protein
MVRKLATKIRNAGTDTNEDQWRISPPVFGNRHPSAGILTQIDILAWFKNDELKVLLQMSFLN